MIPLREVAGEPFALGPWCWVLENPRPLLKPIPLRGRQSLFPLARGVEREVVERIGGECLVTH